MSILFNQWELQYLQQTLNRWSNYKGNGAGGGVFSDAETLLVVSIKAKVQVVAGIAIDLTPTENSFLQSLFWIGRQDYGRGSGGSVYETGVRGQVQQRTVKITADILSKLRGAPPVTVLPGETESLES